MSESFKLSGRVHFIGETKSFGTSGFVKREFVLETERDGKYPQMAKFEATKDRTKHLDDIAVGDEVAVEFNVRGREYSKNGTTSYFTSLEAWKIAVTKKGAGASSGGGGTDEIPFASSDAVHEPSPIARVLR